MVKVNCLGCATSLIGIILVIFILTHISDIWIFLENLIG